MRVSEFIGRNCGAGSLRRAFRIRINDIVQSRITISMNAPPLNRLVAEGRATLCALRGRRQENIAPPTARDKSSQSSRSVPGRDAGNDAGGNSDDCAIGRIQSWFCEKNRESYSRSNDATLAHLPLTGDYSWGRGSPSG